MSFGAVFLYGLHTFVHLWALAHVGPFWSHPTNATKGYHQRCGCPQPSAPLVSPGRRLGPAVAQHALQPPVTPLYGRQEKFDKILHFFAMLCMWSIQRCVHRSLPHRSYMWVVPMAGLWFRSRLKSAPENHAEHQANTHMLAKFSRHVVHIGSQLFPPT